MDRSKATRPALPRLGTRGLLVALAATVVACSDGYTTAELDLGDRPVAPEPADIVDQLNRMNRDSLTESRWRFSFAEPCELTLKARRPDGESEVMTLSLQHSHVQVKGIAQPIMTYAVEGLKQEAEPAGTAHLRLELNADRMSDAERQAAADELRRALGLLEKSGRS